MVSRRVGPFAGGFGAPPSSTCSSQDASTSIVSRRGGPSAAAGVGGRGCVLVAAGTRGSEGFLDAMIRNLARRARSTAAVALALAVASCAGSARAPHAPLPASAAIPSAAKPLLSLGEIRVLV